MQLSPQDFNTLYSHGRCELRVHLNEQGVKPTKPGAYTEVLRELGIRFEKEYLLNFPDAVTITDEDFDTAREATVAAVSNNAKVIYQPALKATHIHGGETHTIIGRPDFLIQTGDGYLIRDVKMTRRINQKDHAEIILQLQLYGWLYEQEFGKPPLGLEVFSGKSEIVNIPGDDWNPVLHELGQIIDLRASKEEPYSPVGWTKCNNCGYFNRCWPAAMDRKDVAVVEGVDLGLATALSDIDISTYPELLETMGSADLSDFKRPWGQRTQKVGKKAEAIIRMAKSLETGQEELIKPLEIPGVPNYVMFDLEGLPPHLNDLGKIFLWGMQVFGDEPGEYEAAQSGFGPDGDREGWEDFLNTARVIFNKYGDIPFVHWAPYEKTNIKMYLERYGDPDGIAARVLENLLDLLPIVKGSIALPLPSYSLKVIERYVGFKRSQDEYGGDWAMAQYIRATEFDDDTSRQEVIEQVLLYNREDLEATWAVLQWAQSKETGQW